MRDRLAGTLLASLGRLRTARANVMQIAGLLLIAAGLWLWLPAVALVVSGLCLVWLGQGIQVAESQERERRQRSE